MGSDFIIVTLRLLTLSAVCGLFFFRSDCFLWDLVLYDDLLLRESSDVLPRGSISTSLNIYRTEQS